MNAGETYLRPLNPSESHWANINASSSPLCLLAELDFVVSHEQFVAALATSRALHPYLSVRVDAMQKAIATGTSAIPLTWQVLTPEAASMPQLRTIARKHLLAGVNLAESFVKVHVVATEAQCYLFLIGDHMAFDARSFYAWLSSLLESLEHVEQGAPHAFVDWTTQLPALDLPDLVPLSCLKLPLRAASPAGDDTEPMVEDTVRYLPREVFAALKTASRARQVTLNGPLALLFARAFWDAASVSGGTDAKPPGDAVLASCAVDIRRRLDPPLPHNYISSAAGTANVAIHIPPTASMSSSTAAEQDWKAAALFSVQLAAAIDANEPFRMKQILATHKYAQIAT
jgi:hypothetical protein